MDVKTKVDSKQRVFHMYQKRGKAEKEDAHEQSAKQAKPPTNMLLFWRQAVCGDCDEYQVVDTKHNLQENQGNEANLCFSSRKYR